MKLIYIRAGTIPSCGRSLNHLTNILEKGVSVYEAVYRSSRDVLFVIPGFTASVCVDVSAVFTGNHGKCFPLYEVTGRKVGVGSAGEPVLRNCKVVRRLRWLENKINRKNHSIS